MLRRRWINTRQVRRVPLVVGLGAVIALTAACGGETTPTGSSSPQGSTTTSKSAGGSSTPSTTSSSAQGQGTQVTVSDEAAIRLCDLIRPQLSDWRVQGPSLGGIAFNATVHEWALRNGGINMQVLGDKDVIDRITTTHCADVRTQALQALETPSLASKLAF